MIRAANLAIEINLLRFSQYLQSQGIVHRINEESGRQIIWVEGVRQANFVQQSLETWPFDQHPKPVDEIEEANVSSASISRVSGFAANLLFKFINAFRATPITLALITGCLIVAVLSELGAEVQRVDWLFFPLISSDSLLNLLADITSVEIFARSLTPMFLHFGELHLVFNMLWLWYFGKQLEATHPHMLFAVLIVLTSFAANSSQYLYSNANNFGGMSGVVYGLVGYCWLTHKFMPKSYLLINSGMFVIFVIALLAMELFASSWVANAAHVGGLVVGLLIGLFTVLFYRFVLQRDAITRKPRI
jgi:GlpG protein